MVLNDFPFFLKLKSVFILYAGIASTNISKKKKKEKATNKNLSISISRIAIYVQK